MRDTGRNVASLGPFQTDREMAGQRPYSVLSLFRVQAATTQNMWMSSWKAERFPAAVSTIVLPGRKAY